MTGNFTLSPQYGNGIHFGAKNDLSKMIT